MLDEYLGWNCLSSPSDDNGDNDDNGPETDTLLEEEE